jgi:hypothetical protein
MRYSAISVFFIALPITKEWFGMLFEIYIDFKLRIREILQNTTKYFIPVLIKQHVSA